MKTSVARGNIMAKLLKGVSEAERLTEAVREEE
jgi:hypothetical protein